MLYGQFDAVSEKELSGPRLKNMVCLSLPGGMADGYVTEIDRTTQSAWANNGSFIGLIRPDRQVPTGMVIDALPVVNGRIISPNIGCLEPVGLSDVDKRSVSVLVFVNGTLVKVSGVYLTASLDEVVRLVQG